MNVVSVLETPVRSHPVGDICAWTNQGLPRLYFSGSGPRLTEATRYKCTTIIRKVVSSSILHQSSFSSEKKTSPIGMLSSRRSWIDMQATNEKENLAMVPCRVYFLCPSGISVRTTPSLWIYLHTTSSANLEIPVHLGNVFWTVEFV